ncbi:glycosyltransferase family 4 protein [Campylobacter helveticus]|uniref:glycosyltransferase family 4 protein n=1 Tax=Campylobacter helveticus TaxID=28898 RepID=UPI0009C1E302|nr:glycosyltransferase family 4 protein [Campylobacter helveticus]ARE80168.1 glycosyltransferase, family 1 [Campylobacter helveticus]TNB59866.1 glycosyltransferase family 4 protein [Campylobacter helveticus]TNH33559.1 glycosyltransferase family 4 protein [Campylobacter helveticus]TXK56714.1 glycosyltransferase family 4 protein [Campylobacter helveticus]SMC18510.1 Glycosyltransferase involved in cell wall bisynthesis [Campylobacter helveticus]
MERKKIVLLIGDITTGGGSERVVSHLANAFCEFYEVELLSIYKANETPTFALDDRIKLSFLHFKERKRVRTFFYKLIDKFYESYLLKQKCKEADIIIYNNCPHYPLFKNKNTHYLYILHERQKKFRTKYKHYDALIAINLKQKALLEKHHKNVIYIPNFLPKIPDVITNHQQKVVLYLGRFSKEKGVLRLIDIWKKVQEEAKFREWNLVFVGDGVLKEAMQDKINKLNLNDTIIIKGFTNDVEKEYLGASIYAMSSYNEGFGMVLIESASYGLPSVAFDIAGLSDIIENEKSGFLIEDDDLKDYADKLQILMRDENLRKTMGENAKQIVKKRFSKEIILKKWQDLFDSYC